MGPNFCPEVVSFDELVRESSRSIGSGEDGSRTAAGNGWGDAYSCTVELPSKADTMISCILDGVLVKKAMRIAVGGVDVISSWSTEEKGSATGGGCDKVSLPFNFGDGTIRIDHKECLIAAEEDVVIVGLSEPKIGANTDVSNAVVKEIFGFEG